MYRSLACFAAFLLAAGPVTAHPPASEDIERVTRQLHEHPDAALLLERAELHRVSGQWDAAEHDARETLALEPDLFAARLSLARTAFAAGDPSTAVAEAQQYLASSPDAKGYRVLAEALTALGRHGEAVSARLRAIDTADPADPGDYLEAAWLLAKQEPPDPAAALAVLGKGMDRLGPLVTLQAAAADIARGAGRTEEALRHVDGILAHVGRSEHWLAERGRILLDAGRKPEAWAAFSEALAAIDRLPAHHRQTAAVRRLETELEERLRS